jgi:hypothetical protein
MQNVPVEPFNSLKIRSSAATRDHQNETDSGGYLGASVVEHSSAAGQFGR